MKNIVVVAGHAGSGKTEFSKRISRHMGLPLLDKDTLARPFVDALADQLTGDHNDRQSATYLERIRPLEYEVLLTTMWEVLEFGASGVVVTAPFAKELNDLDWIETFKSKCNTKNVNLTLVWVHCDKESLKKRIVNRDASRDDWKVQNWDEWSESLVDPLFVENCIRVDNSDDSMESLMSSVELIMESLSVV